MHRCRVGTQISARLSPRPISLPRPHNCFAGGERRGKRARRVAVCEICTELGFAGMDPSAPQPRPPARRGALANPPCDGASPPQRRSHCRSPASTAAGRPAPRRTGAGFVSVPAFPPPSAVARSDLARSAVDPSV